MEKEYSSGAKDIKKVSTFLKKEVYGDDKK